MQLLWRWIIFYTICFATSFLNFLDILLYSLMLIIENKEITYATYKKRNILNTLKITNVWLNNNHKRWEKSVQFTEHNTKNYHGIWFFKIAWLVKLLMIKNTFLANTCLFKVNNWSTREWCKICSELTLKTPERRQKRPLVFLLLTLNISHTVSLCFYRWFWTKKCSLDCA